MALAVGDVGENGDVKVGGDVDDIREKPDAVVEIEEFRCVRPGGWWW